MKVDEIILRRFEELEKKAKSVESTSWSHKADSVKYINPMAFHEWATSVEGLLQRVFGEDSSHYINFRKWSEKFVRLAEDFERCWGIFRAAKEDYEGGYTFSFKALVSAEILSDAIEQAEELLKSGYKDPACVVVGVALETALKKLCVHKNIAHGKLDKMNADLCKAGVYNVGMQKQITAWADRRNRAAHGEWDQYSKEDVEEMIKGVNRFIAEYL